MISTNDEAAADAGRGWALLVAVPIVWLAAGVPPPQFGSSHPPPVSVFYRGVAVDFLGEK
jgi:hypothetical protein